MNYRHAFHAGNFADVVKHALLTRLLVYLTRKETPLFYLDTHAGIGRYDLGGEEASRTREAAEGVGRMEAALPGEAEALLAPWRAVLAQERARFGAQAYPGSPAVAQALTREGGRRDDRLILCEKHPEDARLLAEAMGRDARVKTLEIDGWTGLNATVPPKQRRGLVLIDPPFEEPGEIERMAKGLVSAWRKWPGGVYALWAPIKSPQETRRLGRLAVEAGVRRVLWMEVLVGAPVAAAPRVGGGPPLIGTAMMVVNPPFTLAQEARALLPALATRLARAGEGVARVDELAGEGG